MATTVRPLIHSLDRAALQQACEAIEVPRYRADQLWRWLYIQHAARWDAMSNLPAALRERLAAVYDLEAGDVIAREEAPDGTCKQVIQLRDGHGIEAVLIPSGRRRTVCVSSQVGCRLACAFCASGQDGLQRNLDVGEIVFQVLAAARAWGERPGNVVFMGVGEPFDNYDNVLASIRILNDEAGLNIGARRMTISTCGVVPGIERLKEEGIQVELSVSLHAADDATRSRLMPVNRRWPLDVLLPACRAYATRTGRIITFEYTLIHAINDAEADARRLCERLAGLPSRVNLIPLSEVPEFGARAASPEAARRFMTVIQEAGINATLRDSRGSRVRAACGQLRSRVQASADSS